MEHNAKNGDKKILDACTLPLTGKGVVDTIITDLGVFDIDKTNNQVIMTEIAQGVTVEEVKDRTGCPLVISDNLIDMQE